MQSLTPLLTHSALLVAITAFTMGVSVLARRPTSRLAQQYFVLGLIVCLSFLSFFLRVAFQDVFFARVELLAWVWLGPAGMGLFPLLMGQEPRGWRILRGLAWGLAVGFSVGVLTGWMGPESSGPWLDLLRFSPGILLVQTWGLVFSRWPLSLRDVLILGGAIVTLLSTPLDHMPWLGTTVPALGNLWFCAYLIILGQAINRRRLLDLPSLVVRFLVLLIVAVSFTGLYLLVSTWTEATRAVFLLHSFAVSFFLVILIEPLQAWVARLTRWILARGQSRRIQLDLRQVEQALRDLLQSGADPVAWQQALEEALRRTFDAGSSGLVRHAGVTERMGSIASEIQRRQAMGEPTVLMHSLLENERALSASRIEQERLDALMGEMSRAGFDVVVPFFDSGLLGWVWLSGLRNESKFTPLASAAWVGNVDAFARRIAPSLRTMLRVRTLAEQERLATLGELSAGLAHEIRNPLGAIQGAAELLPQSEWSRVIQQEVGRLEGLVRQFLELSRGRGEADSALVRMDGALWLARIRPRLEGAGLVLQSPPEGIASFMGDPERLFRVVENWVRNSRQAGSTRIEVGIERESEGAEEIGIYVQDNGEGIAEADLHKIFAPFYTTRSEGTGLGLSICRQIAQNHGARIEVRSRKGEGSRFVLWLKGGLE